MMGSEWVGTKPSRSDEILDTEQQLKMAEQIRTHFDSMAPKRPNKPNRSEGDDPISSSSVSIENIPELDKFQALRSQSHPICLEKVAPSVQEEFVETKYYSELNSIDKQHHTTGKGFIRVVEGGGDGFVIKLQEQGAIGIGEMTMGFRSNPATNEWIPNLEEKAILVSSKPNRSESD